MEMAKSICGMATEEASLCRSTLNRFFRNGPRQICRLVWAIALTVLASLAFDVLPVDNSYNSYKLQRASNAMADLSISEARDSLAEIVNRVAYQGERVVLRRHGKAVAALVSAADLERLAALENQKLPRRSRRRGG